MSVHLLGPRVPGNSLGEPPAIYGKGLQRGKRGSVFTRGPSPHNPYAREPVQGTADLFSYKGTQVEMAAMSMQGNTCL
jgi:hypothetical protein